MSDPWASEDAEWEPVEGAEPAGEEAGEHEYLVFVEEEDDGSAVDDRLVLEVARQHSLGEIQVNPEIEVELRNTATPTSTGGLAASLFGAVMGLASIIMFIATYPQGWYDGGKLLVDEPVIWFTALFGVLSGLFLVVGTVLTHYGQRLQASGSLRSLSIVERATGRSARLE